MLQGILPAGVAARETTEDAPDCRLYPVEEAAVAHAVAKRRREYATVRGCARRALGELGLPVGPIPTGAFGAPSWPPGAVGSMTHCAGYRGAAVARSGQFASLGIDAEPNEAMPHGPLRVVADAAERDQLGALTRRHPGVCWDRLLFAAKEAVYKAWYPLTGRWLGFADARIAFQPEQGAFTAALLVPGPRVAGAELRGFTGRFHVTETLLLTAVAVRRAPARRP